MLWYPFRVTTAAYGQNTAFMAILSKNGQVSLKVPKMDFFIKHIFEV